MKFSIGDVLWTSTKLLARNAHKFLAFTAIGYLPLILWTTVLSRGGTLTALDIEHYENGSSWLRMLLDAFGASAIAFGVQASLRGPRAGLFESFATGVRRALPSLVVLIITTIASALGAFLVIVPGVIIFCVTYVAVPVSVLERPGLFAAIERSRALTLGRRFRIFGMLLVVWLVMFALLVVTMVVVTMISGVETDSFFAGMRYLWSLLVFQILYGTVVAVISAVTYVRLRALEEGGDANLGKVFE